ncbi:MAG: helix-turn-helix transcriptional regulator [Chitinophagaceae bacterium]|nr:helix-turn-helix transcriptional regulator [Chitinophagaceae bacterium]MBL0304662.1 helix-turn-helix transcriptional regulator [Chitinophagaceae bacterium]MBP8114427.1 helix-turn-helix transcriptional regulator [Chitinophagaceae bacterium]MBP9104940.1 helix-turn-helix transcriptional regulator [Chitinophagaceae bacterium]
MENNKTDPALSSLVKIAMVLGVPLLNSSAPMTCSKT